VCIIVGEGVRVLHAASLSKEGVIKHIMKVTTV